MAGTGMPHGTWYGAAAGYLGMWMAMMVPMMLPSLVPVLLRYGRSLRGAGGTRRRALVGLAGAGYFAVWAVAGVAVYVAPAGLGVLGARWEAVAAWLPVASGAVLLAAGGVQLSAWKGRRLALCRHGSWEARPPAPTARDAWRQGLGLGMRCLLSCGSLMLGLLAIGMMNPVAMAAAALVIWAERLGSAPRRVARMAGVAMIGVGALMVVREVGIYAR